MIHKQQFSKILQNMSNLSLRRKSTTKSSMFKLQAAKTVFEDYINSIKSCAALKNFPQINETQLLENSESVFNNCFQFSEESSFSRGLNYGCKQLGFATHEGIVKYQEYLPGVLKAFILGDFNQFNSKSHQMTPIQGHDDFFQIEFNTAELDEGSRLILRVIDPQGTEYNMIPPSCMVTKDEYGIYIRYRKNPFLNNQTILTDLLCYTLDMNTIRFDKALDFLNEYKTILQNYNVIVMKNWWNPKSGLIYKFKIEQSKFQIFNEIIQFIHQEIGIKVVLEINCQSAKNHYQGNPVEEKYYCSADNGNRNWAINHPEVLQYYLSILSYYITYFNVDGFDFTKVDYLTSQKQGKVLLMCISIMKNRLFDHGVIIAQSQKKIPGLCYKILEGGLGVDFAINYLENLQLVSNNHRKLQEDISKCLPFFNCLNIKGTNQDINQLNILIAYILSPRGVIYQGNFILKNQEIINKVLHLRNQSQLFQSPFQLSEIGSQILTGKRGNVHIYFNLGQTPLEQKIPNLSTFQLVFNSKTEEPERNGQILVLLPNSCLVLEAKTEND